MSNESTPALTPEQWGTNAATTKLSSVTVGRTYMFGDPTFVEIFVHPRGAPAEEGAVAIHGSADMHALAALCLYGQPFGFTQRDVDFLRDAAINLRSYLKTEEAQRLFRDDQSFISYDAKACDDVAAKIAALLPPSS